MTTSRRKRSVEQGMQDMMMSQWMEEDEWMIRSDDEEMRIKEDEKEQGLINLSPRQTLIMEIVSW